MLSFLGAQLSGSGSPGQLLIPCRLENGRLVQIGNPVPSSRLPGASGFGRLPPPTYSAAPRPLGPVRELQAGLGGQFMIGGRTIESVVTVDPVNGAFLFPFTYISEEKNGFDH